MNKFPFIFALALVTSCKIKCYYSNIDSIRYRTMFNCIIQSRIPQMSVEDIYISLTYEGALRSFTLQHNYFALHYFPLRIKAST